MSNSEPGKVDRKEIEIIDSLEVVGNLLYLIKTDPEAGSRISKYAELAEEPLKRLQQVLGR